MLLSLIYALPAANHSVGGMSLGHIFQFTNINKSKAGSSISADTKFVRQIIFIQYYFLFKWIYSVRNRAEKISYMY